MLKGASYLTHGSTLIFHSLSLTQNYGDAYFAHSSGVVFATFPHKKLSANVSLSGCFRIVTGSVNAFSHTCIIVFVLVFVNDLFQNASHIRLFIHTLQMRVSYIHKHFEIIRTPLQVSPNYLLRLLLLFLLSLLPLSYQYQNTLQH